MSFGFKTVGGTKQAKWGHYLGLAETEQHFSQFPKIVKT